MKKFSKVILSVLLIVTLVATAGVLSAVFSSAQAIAKNVAVAFTGVNDDWVTLSGTTIQDDALSVTLYNDGDDDIIISDFAHNGINITKAGYTANEVISAGQSKNIGISGTTAANSVFTVTIKYRVAGDPVENSETATAYIYCSTQSYSSVQNESYIKSGLGRWGVGTKQTISPVTSGSVSYDDSDTGTYKRYARVSADIYVDGSKYKTWSDFNLIFDFANDDTRDHAFFQHIEMTQTSNTGSLLLGGHGTDPENKSIMSTYDPDNNPEGFFIQVEKNKSLATPFNGTIPTEANSTFTMKLLGYGQTGGVLAAVLAPKTKTLEPQWTFNVYNNNKSALRERLVEISNEGLNKGSYESGWDNFEKALKNAYTVLGTIKVTAAQVSSAVSQLNTAYNNLKRYAVVVTTQNYYQGNDNTNPVQISKDCIMTVKNGSEFNPKVLTNGQYPEYPFNRSSVVTSKTISVGDSTNYTETINQYYWYVDTSALEAALAEQASLVTVDEDGNEMYTADSIQNYADVAAQARRTLNDLTLFQADIDAATRALRDAKAGLERLEFDSDWLAEGIGWAENIIYNAYDYDPGYGWDTDKMFASAYSQELYANLLTAYNEAAEVTADPAFTKAQADRVCVQLWDAIYALRIKDDTTKGLYIDNNIRHADVDRYGYFKSLSDNHIENNGLRVVFNDIVDNTSGAYMLHEEDFTEESWAALQDALYGNFAEGNWEPAATEDYYPVDSEVGELNVPAYSMINNIWYLASQADYNACRDNLIDKVNNLEYVVDFTALETQLARAKTYDLSLYTNASATRLGDDIAYVEAMLEKLDGAQLYGDPEAITQERINEIVSELVSAMNDLVIIPTVETVNTEVKIASGYIRGESIKKNLAQIEADFQIINGDGAVLKAYNTKGNEVALTESVGTGYTLAVELGGEKVAVYTFIIAGDIDGDARITDNDFNNVYSLCISQNTMLKDIFLEAADVNGDGIYNLCDAATVKNFMK